MTKRAQTNLLANTTARSLLPIGASVVAVLNPTSPVLVATVGLIAAFGTASLDIISTVADGKKQKKLEEILYRIEILDQKLNVLLSAIRAAQSFLFTAVVVVACYYVGTFVVRRYDLLIPATAIVFVLGYFYWVERQNRDSSAKTERIQQIGHNLERVERRHRRRNRTIRKWK